MNQFYAQGLRWETPAGNFLFLYFIEEHSAEKEARFGA